MPFLQTLRIILQSKIFVTISLIFIVFYILVFTQFITYESKLDENTTEFRGEVLSYNIDGNKLSMTLQGEEKIQATYYIDTLEEKEYLEENMLIGATVDIKGIISSAYNNTIPNTFNYKEYLYNNQIYVTFSVSEINISYKASFLNDIKNAFIKRIQGLGDSSAYLYAFILGETDYITRDVYQDYQMNGTTHLFAVSGMHIGILTMLLTKLFQKFHIKESIGNIFIVLFLFFYMFLIGFTPSVVRGSLLYIFLLINKKLDLRLKTVYVLYLIFLLLILINPFYIYNLGFIYSFLTSFGLILFSKKITGNYFMKLFKVSAIAFLFSFPVTIYNFYEVNLLTILNNLIIVPLVSSILFPLTLLTFLFPFLDGILCLGINILEFLSHFLNLFAVNLVVPKIGIIFILIYYAAVFLIYKIGIKYLVIIFLLVIIYKIMPYMDSNAYVYFLDIGQGDSAVIIGSNASYALMIDTGGKVSFTSEEWEERSKTYNLSTNTITFLKSLGITRLDALICSHGDYDHMGEAINLVRDFPVDKVIFNNGEYNDLELELIEVLNEHDISYEQNTSALQFGNNTFYFLNEEDYGEENNNSIVLYTVIDGIDLLFMGDAGVDVERGILEKYQIPNIDILKVGHHGSDTSSSRDFIDRIHPLYSIISVGRNNRYGHPHSEVIHNLAHSNIYRTDEDGTIGFKIKNNQLYIETCNP